MIERNPSRRAARPEARKRPTETVFAPSPYRSGAAEPEAAPAYWDALADVLVAGTSRPAIDAVLAQLGRTDGTVDPFHAEPGPSMLRRALLARLNLI